MTAVESLEPKLDFISIGVGNVGKWEPGRKLALPNQLASSALRFGHSDRDIFGLLQAKAEVRNAACCARSRWIALECQDIERPRALNLDLAFIAVVLAHAKQLRVELE
jgi:hypothetical protein